MFVAVISPPSGVTPVASSSQRLPSRDQDASPKPPSLPNSHERSPPVRGSLPIICGRR